MALLELKLFNYRNHIKNEFIFSEGFNVFFGENGVGKTNIVEAVYLLLNGMFLRGNQINDLIHFSHSQACLQGKIRQHGVIFDYEVGLDRRTEKKEHRRNGKKVSNNQLLEDNSIITFMPDHLISLKMGSDYRRQLVDEALIAFRKEYQRLLQNYKKILMQRNKVLKSFVESKLSQEELKIMLKAMNPLFINLSSRLMFERIQYLNNIKTIMNRILQNFFNGSESLEIHYLVSSDHAIDVHDFESIESYHCKRWQELREAELRVGFSLFGAHRHDISFFLNEKNAKTHCSQGQQRLIILSFKMAQIMFFRNIYGRTPYLILDDVLSELDLRNQRIFLEFLSHLPTQIFMTATHQNETWQNILIKKDFYLNQKTLEGIC